MSNFTFIYLANKHCPDCLIFIVRFCSKMVLEIGYWKLRGLVGGIRVLLEYVGEEWKETMYECHLKVRIRNK